MGSTSLSNDVVAAADDSTNVVVKEEKPTVSGVDPFLVEALENPRHRLTVLRMELDIQKFMQRSDQLQFEFQHLPTSYLRCAAHRVAQHYGLQTMALDNSTDGFTSKIIARKVAETRNPAICLSDIPIKQKETETAKSNQVKFVIRSRTNQMSMGDSSENGARRHLMRSVEERLEDYDKARARIFSCPSSPEVEQISSVNSADNLNKNGLECDRSITVVAEEKETVAMKDGASTVAIFRDMEKDRSDPDYNRSYDRYSRGFIPCPDFHLGACNVLQPSFMQYDPGFHQLNNFSRAQTSHLNYMPSNIMTSYSPIGCNQNSPDAVYMQWPTPSMVYAQSYDPIRHAVYTAPVHQQPLSFEHWQNR